MRSDDSANLALEARRRTALPINRRVNWLLQCGRISMVSLPPDELFAGRVDGAFLQVTPVNAEVFVMAHENPNFARLLRHTVNTVDGRVLQWICLLLYPGHRIVLLKGADFILDLAAYCQQRKQRLFLLGSTQESNARAVRFLQQRYPGLEVSGFGPPLSLSPFQSAARERILGGIRSFRPDHLGVCFGPARQEFWIEQNAAELEVLGVRCAYALGGTIDFLSGARPRAPRWIRYAGAEWLFRFLTEPRARFWRTLMQFKMPYYAAHTRRVITPLPPL